MALSSAVLLILSFPNFNQPWCAWVALVPWLLALRGCSSRGAFWWSYLVGAVFFLGSIWWLIHVTLLGWLVLCAYLALYFGLFGWIAHRVLDQRPETRDQRKTFSSSLQSLVSSPLLLLPSAWVSLEFLRSHLLSGFGWNLLGYSQTPWLALIQMADVTGVWGVSWLIVLANVAIADFLQPRTSARRLLPMFLAVGGLMASALYGVAKLAEPVRGAGVRVAVVQGNIPQEQKWDEAFRDAILERYERLTHAADRAGTILAGEGVPRAVKRAAAAPAYRPGGAGRQAPQLIIWPEASVPGILGGDEAVTTRIQRLAQSVSIPLLVGAPMTVPANGIWRLTNSAALLGRDGAVTARYDKLHLVPFGEFVPLESLAPWLRDVLPPIGDFVPGHEYTVFEARDPSQTSDFRLQTSDQRLETRGNALPQVSSLQSPVSGLRSPFSVLVCFEDIFPELARRFVQRGARWLITITNDAWFGRTAAPYQHAQASTFRAVELRVPMVRAANTGWSGCIDSRGRWLASVKDPHGKELFVEGVAVCEFTASESAPTFYQRFGDWFAWLCVLATAWCIMKLLIGIPHGHPR